MFAVNATQLAKTDLEALNFLLDRKRMNAVILRAGVNCVRKKFYALNSARPNKLGGKRTNKWTQLARATQGRDAGDAVVITVNDVAARQLYEGGTIRPGAGKKFITIPYRPIAYAKRAREFDNLQFAIAEVTIE